MLGLPIPDSSCDKVDLATLARLASSVDWLAFSHPLGVLQMAGAAAILLAAAGMNFGWTLTRAKAQEAA